MGVKANFFPLMGEALLETLHECLKEKFTPETENAWKQVYAALSGEMIKAMNDDITVLNSWNQLKKVENYEEVAGVMLFRRSVLCTSLVASKVSGNVYCISGPPLTTSFSFLYILIDVIGCFPGARRRRPYLGFRSIWTPTRPNCSRVDASRCTHNILLKCLTGPWICWRRKSSTRI